MGHRSNILQEDLVRLARALASGRSQAQIARDFGWDTNTLRRCVTRLSLEIQDESERKYWPTATGTALGWLILRNLCTPEELDKARAIARQNALENLEWTLDLGERERKIGTPDAAERRYLIHLRDDPGNVEVLVKLGYCLIDLGRLDDALERFDSVLVATPEHADARYGKAVALDRSGRRREAVETLEEARRHAPDNVHILALLGKWRMDISLDGDGLKMLYDAFMTLVQVYGGKDGFHDYCCKVVEVVLSGYRNRGLLNEAIRVAREARQHGWSTEYIVDTLQECEKKIKARPPLNWNPVPHLFWVQVTVYAKGPPPRHWPEKVAGYHLRLDVVAHHPQDAGTAALEHMLKIEPIAVQFRIDVQHQGEWRQAIDGTPVIVAGEPSWFLQDGSTATVAVTSAPSREPVSRPRTQTRRRTQAPVRRPVGGHRRG